MLWIYNLLITAWNIHPFSKFVKYLFQEEMCTHSPAQAVKIELGVKLKLFAGMDITSTKSRKPIPFENRLCFEPEPIETWSPFLKSTLYIRSRQIGKQILCQKVNLELRDWGVLPKG